MKNNDNLPNLPRVMTSEECWELLLQREPVLDLVEKSKRALLNSLAVELGCDPALKATAEELKTEILKHVQWLSDRAHREGNEARPRSLFFYSAEEHEKIVAKRDSKIRELEAKLVIAKRCGCVE